MIIQLAILSRLAYSNINSQEDLVAEQYGSVENVKVVLMRVIYFKINALCRVVRTTSRYSIDCHLRSVIYFLPVLPTFGNLAGERICMVFFSHNLRPVLLSKLAVE